MDGQGPAIWWIRRDLRLRDNPALVAACSEGGPVLPLFIKDPSVEALGAAPSWRLGEALRVLDRKLRSLGSRLLLRGGPALETLQALIDETGATSVHWTRLYDPQSIERDTGVKSALSAVGVGARSHAGHLLFEPWTVETKTGGYFKVYTPMWKSVNGREVSQPAAKPAKLPVPGAWPTSERLEAWNLGARMRRGARIIEQHVAVGEEAALDRLNLFTDEILAGYSVSRDRVDMDGTSRLSAHLALGEIGPRTCWHAGQRALQEGKPGAETFLKELVWREFAYHLMYHTPHILTENWRPEWSAFPWEEDANSAMVEAWQRGRTGLPFVDAAMREMYVTGTMHNRGRMIVASYLTKHLLTHWRIGLKWFEDCLVDWDPASNAMGWQWSAGSGPDATPYFRVFNPVSQLDKFDPQRAYTGRWIAEGKSHPSEDALSYFDAIPASWKMRASDPYPAPIVSPEAGRARALEAYKNRTF